ncbi:MAG: peptidoglycan-binding protein [Actinomycetota bacterium]
MATRVLIGLAAIAMVASACSSGGSDETAGDGGGSTGAETTATSAVDNGEGPTTTAGSTTDAEGGAETGDGASGTATDDTSTDDTATDDAASDGAASDDETDAAIDAATDTASDDAETAASAEATAGGDGTDPDGDDAGGPDDERAAPATDTDVTFLYPSAPGDSGPKVEKMQALLSDLGFGAGTPDGDYGGRTERAVEAFQDFVGLPVTGVADSYTVFTLGNYRYDGLVLRAGDEGDAVEELQQRLADGPFDPGPVDGAYGTTTVQAVWALEKLAGVPVDGDWGPLDELAWNRLQDGEVGAPTKEHEERWVEVDLSEQLAKVYDPGDAAPTLVVHISSGSGVPWDNGEFSGSSVTPRGEFHINRRINGWRESSLNIGRLYNPLYFNGGIAFHGATSVPLYPASHGCVRLPMHIAEYMPDELPNGTTVHILD